MTGHHGTPVPVTTRGMSSQAGIASRFSAGPGSPVVRIPRAIRYCPAGHPIRTRYQAQPDGDSIPIDECTSCDWQEDR